MRNSIFTLLTIVFFSATCISSQAYACERSAEGYCAEHRTIRNRVIVGHRKEVVSVPVYATRTQEITVPRPCDNCEQPIVIATVTGPCIGKPGWWKISFNPFGMKIIHPETDVYIGIGTRVKIYEQAGTGRMRFKVLGDFVS